jgi:hypothetical protein
MTIQAVSIRANGATLTQYPSGRIAIQYADGRPSVSMLSGGRRLSLASASAFLMAAQRDAEGVPFRSVRAFSTVSAIAMVAQGARI